MHSFIFSASFEFAFAAILFVFHQSQDLVPRSSHSLSWPPFWINFHSQRTNQSRDFCCVPGSSIPPPPYWKARRPWGRGWSIDSCQNKSCTLAPNRGIVHTKRDYSLLSTLIRFQKYAFSFSSKMHRSIRLHTTVLVRFRIARCDVCWTLYARCKHTLLWYFRSSFSFWSVFERFRPSTLIGYPMYAFHSDEPLRTFSNRRVVMKTLSVLVWTKREWSIILSCVDERPKRRIEMYAFYHEQNIYMHSWFLNYSFKMALYSISYNKPR